MKITILDRVSLYLYNKAGRTTSSDKANKILDQIQEVVNNPKKMERMMNNKTIRQALLNKRSKTNSVELKNKISELITIENHEHKAISLLQRIYAEETISYRG
ncbi:hypothetical protein [Erwinia pyrifoliae]|uniref:hypothetical protein n=1 Tax=Erwinia pyrifoliae TaxID=79967 RepID=UPI00223AE4A5|nr:hypothetical protein [Erwinia pyrifoliae]MCT2385635.1 hypothetical protein [Erwinia pyrifoliae]MCT2385637.1 hypothetical protein [Erwinia pyrifoliae]MCU8588788.1 hypothetical protein [Erwinia pyrifoliae]MCU8588790.1 hypothetical protein [Erwinia pyrifoliae]